MTEVRKTPGWERIRVQVASGAIDTAGPKDISRTFRVKETLISKKVMRDMAANWSNIKNNGDKMVAGPGTQNRVKERISGFSAQAPTKCWERPSR